jgi:hypothetical protein
MPEPLHKLRDGRGHWAVNPGPQGPIRSLEDLHLFVYAPMAARKGVVAKPPAQRAPESPPLPVRVDSSRWVVVCPDCGGAEFAWPDAPWFLCGSCFNATTDGRWRPVV